MQPANLYRFYESRDFRPAWINQRGPSGQVDHLLEAINEADLEGLRPSAYHLGAIQTILELIGRDPSAGNAPLHVELELLLTDAFLAYASDLSRGRVDPRQIHPRWTVRRSQQDLAETLEGALQLNQVHSVLAGLRPRQAGYEALRRTLREYRKKTAQEDRPVIPPGPNLQVEDRNGRVPILRRRLLLEGDLPPQLRTPDPPYFDRNLEDAVKHFQARHGLTVDAWVPPRSRR